MFKKCPDLVQYLTNLINQLSYIYHTLTPAGFRLLNASRTFKLGDLKPVFATCDHPDYVYIYPCLQMQSMGIKQDTQFSEIVWSALASIKESNSEILFCTGYFNVCKRFEKFILKSKDNWKILTSAPEANSFYNSNGYSSCIPELYQYNLHSIVEKSKKWNNNVAAYEYHDSEHSFHAKGNFLYHL